MAFCPGVSYARLLSRSHAYINGSYAPAGSVPEPIRDAVPPTEHAYGPPASAVGTRLLTFTVAVVVVTPPSSSLTLSPTVKAPLSLALKLTVCPGVS